MKKTKYPQTWEVTKAMIRYQILWLPVVLEAMGLYETGGLTAVLSLVLTGTDKGVHETKKGVLKDFKGLLPF